MHKYIIGLIVITAVGIISYKVAVLGYSPSLMLPERNYSVVTTLSGNTDKTRVQLKSYLPIDNYRQKIFNESFSSDDFEYEILNEGENRVIAFKGNNLEGAFKIDIKYSVWSSGVSWDIDKNIEVDKREKDKFSFYLQETPMIPFNDKRITNLYNNLIGKDKKVYSIIKKSYDYIKEFETLEFKGATSAVTALLLKKASCNGKSRLMVGLLRKAGIPARLVGGLILKNAKKKISHQWIEVNIKDRWVSFDTTNNHFASIPANYLKIYVGDEVMFSHTPDISFNWRFNMSSYLTPSTNLYRLKSSKLNVLDLFGEFQKTGVSINILKILLMIPIGALIATFFRNVVGLQTFGTFLPALIASSSMQTGIFWGLVGFVFVIFVVSILRIFFEKLDLMHTPKLSAMLSIVVLLVVSLSILSVNTPYVNLSHVSLFPIAILTLTSERFSITVEEKGYLKALAIMIQTLFVTAICYGFMSSLFLQTAFLAFPELSVLIIGANLWLGRWVGLRVTEFWRFKSLILKGVK